MSSIKSTNSPPSEFKVKPFAHQLNALNAWGDIPRFALFCEMGTGKTYIAINKAVQWAREGKVRAVVILAPRSLLGVWEAEIGKYCAIDYSLHILDKPKAWAKLPSHFLEKKDRPFIRFIITNYEQLLTKKGDKLGNTEGIDLLIMDESTMVKNSFAKRSMRTKKLASKISRAVILTGNATPNGPLDLYSQFDILKTGLIGYSNFYPFRHRYAKLENQPVGGGRTIKKVIGYHEDRIEAEIRPRISPYVFRIQKHECFDLPPKLYQIRELTMGTDQARAYKTLRDAAIAEFKGKTLKAPIVIARMTRLSQLAGGFFPHDEGDLEVFNPNPKLNELGAILEEIDGKFIVWTRFRAELDAVHGFLEERGIQLVRIDGDKKVEERTDAINQFQTNPNVRAFIGITSAGKFGLTLTEAKTMIYYSNSFEFEVRNQSEDRVHRAGLKHPVTYIDLVVKGTIDKLILRALNEKKNLSNFIKDLTAEEMF